MSEEGNVVSKKKNPLEGTGAGELAAHGQLTRRRLLQLAGYTVGGAVLGGSLLAACGNKETTSPSPGATASYGDLGNRLILVSWPNYHDPANLKAFTEKTGVKVDLKVFGSNEEMLAKLQIGSTGWDVFVPTQYAVPTYVQQQLVEPLDLSRIPNFDASQYEARFLDATKVTGDDSSYAIPKDWGTTGFAIWNDVITSNPTSWKEFWDGTMGDWSGKVAIHDYMLTSIGNALKYYGYSFNSVDPGELAQAEKLLTAAWPHLFGITSDYQPPMRAKDVWTTMSWNGDANQMHSDEPQIEYVLGSEGGEIFVDNWSIVADSKRKNAAYAFLDFMIDPAIAAKDTLFHGYAQVDKRATALLPQEMLTNPIMYPAAEALAPLEFAAAEALTSPERSDLWARVKAT